MLTISTVSSCRYAYVNEAIKALVAGARVFVDVLQELHRHPSIIGSVGKGDGVGSQIFLHVCNLHLIILGRKANHLCKVNFAREHGTELRLAGPRGRGEELREVLKGGYHV